MLVTLIIFVAEICECRTLVPTNEPFSNVIVATVPRRGLLTQMLSSSAAHHTGNPHLYHYHLLSLERCKTRTEIFLIYLLHTLSLTSTHVRADNFT